MDEKNLVDVTKNYYDSADADAFYHLVWGGEDIHIGIYDSDDDSIRAASARSVEKMVQTLPPLSEQHHLLDMGSGYGGAARYLAKEFGCQVTCLNLSETENKRNREKTAAAGLQNRLTVEEGNFEEMPYPDAHFDVVWCQDSILHSSRKAAVIAEVARVLKRGGHFIFTDPMQSDQCPEGVLDPILDRIHLEEMGSVALYRKLAEKNGLEERLIQEMPLQLVQHYTRVKQELEKNRAQLAGRCSEAYIDKMLKGLNHWIEGGKAGYLNWGILHFQKAD